MADGSAVWREGGSERFAAVITDAGRAAVGAPLPVPATDAAATSVGKKIDAVLALLRREDGATIPELIGVTGWLPHMTRAALTGLRKKRHDVTRDKRSEATCYRVRAGA